MKLPFPESGGPSAQVQLLPTFRKPLAGPRPSFSQVRAMEGESEESAPPRPLGRKGAPKAWPQDDTTLNNFSAEFCNGHPLSTGEGVGFCNHLNG